jgi:hypothetical protein
MYPILSAADASYKHRSWNQQTQGRIVSQQSLESDLRLGRSPFFAYLSALGRSNIPNRLSQSLRIDEGTRFALDVPGVR